MINRHGLHEDYIVKALIGLVIRKLDDTNQMKWPSKPKDVIGCLENSKQVACTYNTVSYVINPRETKTKNRYADVNSHQQVEKIAAIIQSWEALI